MENSIRCVQAKVRPLKCHAESDTGMEIDKLADLMSWLVQRGGDLITRCLTGKVKKTVYEGM